MKSSRWTRFIITWDFVVFLHGVNFYWLSLKRQNKWNFARNTMFGTLKHGDLCLCSDGNTIGRVYWPPHLQLHLPKYTEKTVKHPPLMVKLFPLLWYQWFGNLTQECECEPGYVLKYIKWPVFIFIWKCKGKNIQDGAPYHNFMPVTVAEW